MSVQLQPQRVWPKPGEVFYPESDGKPMAENTLQYRWMVLIIENIRRFFAHDPNDYYDPDRGELRAWLRQEDRLLPVTQVEGFASPRLKFRFWPSAGEMKIERPDGTAFESFTQLAEEAQAERQRAELLAEKLRALGIDPNAGE